MRKFAILFLSLSTYTFAVNGLGDSGQQASAQEIANAQNHAGGQLKAQAFQGFATGAACLGEKYMENGEKAEQAAQQMYGDGGLQTQTVMVCVDQKTKNIVPEENTLNLGDGKSATVCPEGSSGRPANSWAEISGGKYKEYNYDEMTAKKKEKLEELEKEYKSDNWGKGLLSMVECAGHIMKGVFDLKASKALKEAAKTNQDLATQLNVDPNDPNYFRDPDILAGENPYGFIPQGPEIQPADGSVVTGDPEAAGDGDESFKGDIPQDPTVPGPKLSALRDALNRPVQDDGGASAGGGAGGGGFGGGGFNDNSDKSDKKDTQEKSAGGIGKYAVATGGAGKGISKLQGGTNNPASPESVQKAFDSLLKGILGEDPTKGKKDLGNLAMLDASRNPANNLEATGDESINITSKSLFEIVSERIEISRRRGNISHPSW